MSACSFAGRAEYATCAPLAAGEALLEASIEIFAHSRPAWAPGLPTASSAPGLMRAGPRQRGNSALDRAGTPAHLRC